MFLVLGWGYWGMMDKKEVTMEARKGRERGVYRLGNGCRGCRYIYIRVIVSDEKTYFQQLCANLVLAVFADLFLE